MVSRVSSPFFPTSSWRVGVGLGLRPRVRRVSYDDEITIRMKKQFANNRCLAGTMIWAVDLDSADSRTLHALADQRSVGPGRPTMPGNVFREQQAQDKIQQQNRAALVSDGAPPRRCTRSCGPDRTDRRRWCSSSCC